MELLDKLLGNLDAQLQILTRVAIAMLLGGLVGIEREYANKPAGFRTHMMVAGAAALLVGLADVLVERFSREAYSDILRTDPVRIVEAVITGVSFLGAGTIFFRRKDQVIKGLTTAASLLLVSAIGMAAALEQFVLAISVAVLSLLVLRVMRLIDKQME